MNIDSTKIDGIDGLRRIETYNTDKFNYDMMEETHMVYPHDELFGDYIPIQIYVDCPPEKVFEYMKSVHSLSEWTYSVRDFTEVSDGLYEGYDKVGSETKIFCEVKSNKEALTVDYHCAWDQGEDLWMIYLNRIVPAKLVLKKPGSVIFWQNCRHPYYDKNPYSEKAPKGRSVWVGDLWEFFYAGHKAEFENLKRILEYRHKNDLPMGPFLEKGE